MEIVIAVFAAVVGIGAGAGVGLMWKNARLKQDEVSARSVAERIVDKAEEETKNLLLDAKEEALQTRQSAEGEVRDRRRELQRAEDRIVSREEGVDKRQETVELREERLGDREKEVEVAREEVVVLKQQESETLERIAGTIRYRGEGPDHGDRRGRDGARARQAVLQP